MYKIKILTKSIISQCFKMINKNSSTSFKSTQTISNLASIIKVFPIFKKLHKNNNNFPFKFCSINLCRTYFFIQALFLVLIILPRSRCKIVRIASRPLLILRLKRSICQQMNARIRIALRTSQFLCLFAEISLIVIVNNQIYSQILDLWVLASTTMQQILMRFHYLRLFHQFNRNRIQKLTGEYTI